MFLWYPQSRSNADKCDFGETGACPIPGTPSNTLSGGQKQRVAVARAIITNPEILLADEPTGALDSKSSAALLDVFDDINDRGQTILMVTHSTSAASRAKRVLFIKDGILYNQIFRGDKTERQMFQEISDTLTVMASEVSQGV